MGGNLGFMAGMQWGTSQGPRAPRREGRWNHEGLLPGSAGEALGLGAPHSEGTSPGFARPRPGRLPPSAAQWGSRWEVWQSVAVAPGNRPQWGRAGRAGARPLLARKPRASRGSVPEGHGEPRGAAAFPPRGLLRVPRRRWARVPGPGKGRRQGAGAGRGGPGRAALPPLPCRRRPQAHAQSPGSRAARGLALPGWARTRLGWARRAEEEGGRERRAGGRKGEERSGPSQSGGARSADARETEQRLPARPAPRSRCRRVSRDPGLGAAGAARRGGAGSGRGKVGRSGGRSDAAPRRGPGCGGRGGRQGQGARGPGSGRPGGGPAAGSGACAGRAHGGGPGGGRAGAPRGSGRAPSAARGQAGRAPRRCGARRSEPAEASPPGNR